MKPSVLRQPAPPGRARSGALLLALLFMLASPPLSGAQPPQSDGAEPPVPDSVGDGPPVPSPGESPAEPPEPAEVADGSPQPPVPESAAPEPPAAEEEGRPEENGKSAAEQATPPAETATDHQERLSPWERLVWWLGKFHPAAIAFPVGVIVATAVAELLFRITGRPLFDAGSRYGIWFAGLATPVVAALGWALSFYHPTDPEWILETHRWLGTSMAVVAVLTLVIGEISFRRGSAALRATYRLLLAVAFSLVLVTGFFGGSMIYGIDHYDWPSADRAAHVDDDEHAEPEDADRGGEPAAVVEMTNDFTYEPARVTVPVGATIRWTNPSRVYHTVTADPDRANDPDHVRLPDGVEPFDSGRIESGETYSRTFDVPGFYRYFCIPHERGGMIGEVEVTEESESGEGGNSESHE